MDKREQLQTMLETIRRSSNVYFQPGSNITIQYPCIVYSRDTGRTRFADNIPYNHKKKWSITVIDRDPDTTVPDALIMLPMCVHNRSYTAKNLYHHVFSLYF